MEAIEISAKTVNDAIALALTRLGVQRDDLEVEVITEGRPGILGFGSEEARIRVHLRPTPAPAAGEGEPAETDQPSSDAESSEVATGREVLQDLLHLMGLEATVTVRPTSGLPSMSDSDAPALDVTGPDLGILIGRRGETLSALQFIVNLIITRKIGHHRPLLVDVEGYRVRREESLRSLAARMAERAVETGQQVTMEAMPPAERRVVHMSLADHPGVTTASIGEDEHRKVVISPRS